MSEEKSIKETMELLEGIKEIAVFGKKVFKDGKVNFADLMLFADLLKKQEQLIAAFKDADEVLIEAKDLSSEEAGQIIAYVMAAVKEYKEA